MAEGGGPHGLHTRKGRKLHFASSSPNDLKNSRKRMKELLMSSTPTVSRMECIEREATPTSTVRSPTLEAMMGPTRAGKGK